MATVIFDLTRGGNDHLTKAVARQHPKLEHLRPFVALSVDVRGEDGGLEDDLALYFYNREHARVFLFQLQAALEAIEVVGG